MEEHTKALAELTAAISTLTSKIDEIHPVVLELQGWKPTIERSVEDLRAEVGDFALASGASGAGGGSRGSRGGQGEGGGAADPAV